MQDNQMIRMEGNQRFVSAGKFQEGVGANRRPVPQIRHQNSRVAALAQLHEQNVARSEQIGVHERREPDQNYSEMRGPVSQKGWLFEPEHPAYTE